MRHTRLVLFSRLAVTALALWLAGLAAIDGYGRVDRARPADVIVVLGSRVYSNGPGPALTRRTQHAVKLYQQGLAPYVLCTGARGPDEPAGTTEARAACGLAESLGLPPAAVVLEEAARSTEENAIYTGALMQARGWTTAILVSDGYHLFRAELLFSRAGVTAYPSPAQLTSGPMHPAERAYRESRELAALMWYWGKAALGLRVTDFP